MALYADKVLNQRLDTARKRPGWRDNRKQEAFDLSKATPEAMDEIWRNPPLKPPGEYP